MNGLCNYDGLFSLRGTCWDCRKSFTSCMIDSEVGILTFRKYHLEVPTFMSGKFFTSKSVTKIRTDVIVC